MRSGISRPEKRRRANVIFANPFFSVVRLSLCFFGSDHRGACSECSEKQLLVSIRATASLRRGTRVPWVLTETPECIPIQAGSWEHHSASSFLR